jgi:hypothetical protein
MAEEKAVEAPKATSAQGYGVRRDSGPIALQAFWACKSNRYTSSEWDMPSMPQRWSLAEFAAHFTRSPRTIWR